MALAQQGYKTPQEAVDALVASAKTDDQKAALVVLGREGEDIISSGDNASDSAVRQRFVTSYEAKHQIAMDGDNKATLVIGDNDYPFPIPLIKKAGLWSFDTEAGRREILFRRIGRNELDAIQTGLAYVDAQNEYADKDRTGAGTGVYAQRSSARPARRTACTGQPRRAKKKSARRVVRHRVPPRLSRRPRPFAVSRLLLQDPDTAGTGRSGRCCRLRRQGQDDRRLRARRLSG